MLGNYLNPLAPAVNFFLAVWSALPPILHDVFYVSLSLLVSFAFYKLLSR